VRTVGIFEAKAKLSEICDQVARITRRGKPLVRIDPVAQDRCSVWEDRAVYIAEKGRMTEEFDIPERSREVPASPLDD